jgi:glycosyltransferase involved in cell wall biosynthesis
MRTSLIIPAYNEEQAIKKVVDEALDYADEIIVVDDGSIDNTAKIVRQNFSKNAKVKLIRHAINQGKADALRTGVSNATGEIVVFIDADDTYPCRHIPELAKKIEKREADVVIGSRFMPNPPANMSFSHRMGNKLFSGLVSYISSTDITDSQSGMRAFKREIFPEIDVKAKSLEYEPKATARAAKLGYKIKEIPIGYRERIGKSKINGTKDGIKILFSLISVAYSETTLLARMIMIPGIVIGFIGLLIGIGLIKDYLILGIVKRPYYPLITVLSLLVSIQLFSLGLIIDNITKKLSRMEEAIKKKGK